jgi:hypothetical protein
MKHLKTFNEAMFVDELGSLQLPDYLMDDPNDTEDDAYEKGKEAKYNDCDIDENPYSDEYLKGTWKDGFNSPY